MLDHPKSDATDAATGGNAKGLLVIDDAVIHRTLISRIAEQIGFLVITAGSYPEAVSLLQGRTFDGITLDLGLGEHDGVEILHLLAEVGRRIPVLIISGAEKEVCDQAVAIGRSLGLDIRAVFPKPVELQAMRAQLERIRTKAAAPP